MTDTAAIIQRFNRAFTERDAALLRTLVSTDCVMEAASPAPDGARLQGRDACLAYWEAILNDRTRQFDPEEVTVAGDRATVRWRYRFGSGPTDYVRGVNLMRVRDGLIVEALGYSKAPGR